MCFPDIRCAFKRLTYICHFKIFSVYFHTFQSPEKFHACISNHLALENYIPQIREVVFQLASEMQMSAQVSL